MLRLLGGALVVGVTLLVVDPRAVIDQLADLRLRWVLLAASLSPVLHVVLACRWKYIAERLDAPLRFSHALRDYYLAGFVNQALPTGLAGAALRAIRHGRQSRPDGTLIGLGTAASAVVIDRIAGLAALCVCGLVAAIVLCFERPMAGLVGAGSVLAMLVVGCTAFWLTARNARFGREFVVSARRALWQGKAVAHQGLLSLLGVGLLSLTFYCAARASGVDAGLVRTMVMAPLILGAMSIPLAVGGWGVREAAAAALFASLGMAASTGVAVSVAFGATSLLASAPGLVVWLLPTQRVRRPDGDTAPGLP